MLGSGSMKAGSAVGTWKRTSKDTGWARRIEDAGTAIGKLDADAGPCHSTIFEVLASVALKRA